MISKSSSKQQWTWPRKHTFSAFWAIHTFSRWEPLVKTICSHPITFWYWIDYTIHWKIGLRARGRSNQIIWRIVCWFGIEEGRCSCFGKRGWVLLRIWLELWITCMSWVSSIVMWWVRYFRHWDTVGIVFDILVLTSTSYVFCLPLETRERWVWQQRSCKAVWLWLSQRSPQRRWVCQWNVQTHG